MQPIENAFAPMLQLLRDPENQKHSMSLEVFTAGERGEVVDGRLLAENGSWYRIENSIVDLLPHGLRNSDRHRAFVARYGLQVGSHSATVLPAELVSHQKQIEFFRSDSVVYDNDVSNLPFYRFFDSMYMHSWIANLPAKQLVLDVGGGTGRQAIPLAQAGHAVLCSDISEDMLMHAVNKARAEKLTDRIVFLACDAENLPVQDGAFDAAICYGALHHMASPHRAISHAARALKLGGRWFSVDPHDSPLRFIFEIAMRFKKLYDEVAADEEHLTGAELKQLCAEAGITVQIRYSTYVLPHMTNALPEAWGRRLLEVTDRMFQNIPLINRTGGIVISEGFRRPSTTVL